MFLQLNHQKLEVFSESRCRVVECYRLVSIFPAQEKFGITFQIRRAALSVHLNIAEGATRRSESERKRYFEIARGFLVEIDAALDIALDLNYIDNFDLSKLGELIILCFKLLSGLIRN